MRRELRQITQTMARELLHSGSAATWREAIERADIELRCAAKCKATGKRCRARPVEGKRVCRVHGGLTPLHTEEWKGHKRVLAANQPRDARGWWIKAETADG
jgi:hypothetical protein